MNKFQLIFANYFSLSRKETNGLFVLFTLTLLIIGITSTYKKLATTGEKTTISTTKTLDSITLVIENTNLSQPNYKANVRVNDKVVVHIKFNPNYSTLQLLIKNGIPSPIAQRILRYRSKGGTFKIKSDLKKIYGFQEKLYAQIEPYIELPESQSFPKKIYGPTPSYSSKKIILIDLNTTDTNQFILLKGIGKMFATRIMKYRNKLGGFINAEQLNEVYGLDSLTIKELIKNSYIEKTFYPTKISINKASLSQLNSHPYIGYSFGKLIYNYKLQHGDYTSIEDLKNLKTINEKTIQKILPYISIE